MRRLLLNPGPTNVHPSVRAAAFQAPDWCHRDPEFARKVQSVCRKLAAIAGGQDRYDAVPFVASGTGANEAMLSVVHGRVLFLVAGRYSERLWLIAQRLGVQALRLDFDPLAGIDCARVAQALAGDPRITDICLVHHETTTGVLAPLPELGQLAREFKVGLLIDGISSIGGHDFDLCRDHVAMATVTANKCLESLPGISFLLASREVLQATQGRSRSFYFDVHEQWTRSAATGKTPFTAAVPLFFAADAALDRLLAETVQGRAQRYRRLKRRLEDELLALGFALLPLPEDRKANILTLARLPAGWQYDALYEALMREHITIYTDEATLRKGMVFFATLGDMHDADLDRFVGALEKFGVQRARLERPAGAVPR